MNLNPGLFLMVANGRGRDGQPDPCSSRTYGHKPSLELVGVPGLQPGPWDGVSWNGGDTLASRGAGLDRGSYALIYICTDMQFTTFHTLADPSRLQIVEALLARECAVNDLVAQMDIHQSGVSRHLRTLKRPGSSASGPGAYGACIRFVPSRFRSWTHGSRSAGPWGRRVSKHVPRRWDAHSVQGAPMTPSLSPSPWEPLASRRSCSRCLPGASPDT